MHLFKRCCITAVFFTTILSIVGACKKSPANPDPDPGGEEPGNKDTTVVRPVTDPATSKTMGFFIDDWQPKTFAAPSYTEVAAVTTATANNVTIDASSVITKIPLSVFSHNANTWMTPMVTEPKLLSALTTLHPHIIRWPCGSCSDVYFWNQPENTLPADVPAEIMDNNGVIKSPGYWYGRTNNNWSASLDNYYSVLQQTGNRGMITVNYGYARYGTSDNPVAAAAHLAADWVRYDNGRTTYWEIGNETYGEWEWGYRIDVSKNKDGQPELVTGQLYGEHFRVFADSMRKAAEETGKTIYIGATLYESAPQSWQTNAVKTWNSGLFSSVGDKADFYIVHNYFTPYNENSTAQTILNAATSVPGEMINLAKTNIGLGSATVKPIALTEYNMWAKDSKQQVSNVSGLFAAIVLGESLKAGYGFAARWDLLNGWENGNDHGLFSDGNEPGIPKWTPRPSYYYLYYLQQFLGDRLVPAPIVGNTALRTYASTFTSGQAAVSLFNTSKSAITVEIKTKNFRKGKRFYYYTLEGGNDNGEFSAKVLINGTGPSIAAGGPENFTSIKANASSTQNGIKVTVPPLGAVFTVIDKE